MADAFGDLLWSAFRVVGSALALGIIAHWAWLQLKDRGRLKVRRRVLVNLASGRTFGGVLWCETGDWLVVRDAEMMEPGREAVSVDGEVVLDRRQVEFVQAL